MGTSVGTGVGIAFSATPAVSLAQIQALFAPSDIAVFFGPTSALYSNAAGTTTAVVGNQVAFRRNIARTSYTPVTFANGDFATNISNWQKGSNVGTMEWVGGELQFVGGGPANGSGNNWVYFMMIFAPTGTAVFGRTVKVSFDATWVSGGYFTCCPAGYAPMYTIQAAANGGVKTRYTFEGVSSFSSAVTRVGIFGAGFGAVWKIDNVVIELYDALDAFQATTALCPTLRQTSSSNRRWLEAVDSDDALNIVFASAPGTMYVGRFTSEGVEWTTESWGTTVNTIRQARYNGGLIARNRDWTAAEKALIESYRARYLPTLGVNLFANPGFDADTNWTKGGAEITIGSGVASKATSAGALAVTQSIATVSELALYGYDLVSRSAGTFGFAGAPAPSVSTAGVTYKWAGYATNAAVGPNGVAAAVGSIDNAFYRRIT